MPVPEGVPAETTSNNMFLKNLTIIATAFLTLYVGAITFSVLSSCTKTPKVSPVEVVMSARAAEELKLRNLINKINEI